MRKVSVVLGHGHSSIEILHSLFPIFATSGQLPEYHFKLVDYRITSLTKHHGDILIITRKFQNYGLSLKQVISELQSLRKNFSKIIYFDDSAATSYILFELLPYVDQYWVRSLLKDRSMYANSYYGGRTFSDFYHRYFGINDLHPNYSPVQGRQDFSKIRIAWNIGAGYYPVSTLNPFAKLNSQVRKTLSILSTITPFPFFASIASAYYRNLLDYLELAPLATNRYNLINARFGDNTYSESVGYQRSYYLNHLSECTTIVQGVASYSTYIRECKNQIAMLSPFGWGEICYRDFEALTFGMLLLKPSMDHIDTWPNIYKPSNMISLRWDFEDLDQIRNLQFSVPQSSFTELIVNSKVSYLQSLKTLPERVASLLRGTLSQQ